jgi:hypothetical protein
VAAGKSVCIKLLKFFEDIIPNLLSLPYDRFIRNLNEKYFFSYLANKFTNIFYLSALNLNPLEFKIKYKISCENEIFRVTIRGNDDNIVISSMFLKKLLIDWRNRIKTLLSDNVTLDGFREVKHIFYNELQNKFNSYLPIKASFIPASRATLALASNFIDDYLKKYKDLINILLTRRTRDKRRYISILKAKLEIDDLIFLDSDDGRSVPLDRASDGQQESAYIIMHLDRLGCYYYTYSKYQTVFIEEPSAYLFPPEQKNIIEFIVRTFNILKETRYRVRFFITTCNSYVLDSLNNMLKKGDLIKKYQLKWNNIYKEVKIPGLLKDDFSAYYINHEGIGVNMQNKDGQLIQLKMITETSDAIKKDAENLSKLFEEFSEKKKAEK